MSYPAVYLWIGGSSSDACLLLCIHERLQIHLLSDGRVVPATWTREEFEENDWYSSLLSGFDRHIVDPTSSRRAYWERLA